MLRRHCRHGCRHYVTPFFAILRHAAIMRMLAMLPLFSPFFADADAVNTTPLRHALPLFDASFFRYAFRHCSLMLPPQAAFRCAELPRRAVFAAFDARSPRRRHAVRHQIPHTDTHVTAQQHAE